jgi:hypothetical protein
VKRERMIRDEIAKLFTGFHRINLLLLPFKMSGIILEGNYRKFSRRIKRKLGKLYDSNKQLSLT